MPQALLHFRRVSPEGMLDSGHRFTELIWEKVLFLRCVLYFYSFILGI